MRKVSGLIAGVLCVSVAWDAWSHRTVDQFSFIQVGQGDCAVFREKGTVVMVDTGPRQGSFDAGRRLVWPAIRDLGIDRIDCLVLSHPDMDHIGGLLSISQRVRIDRIVVSEVFRNHPVMQHELQSAGFSGHQIQYINQNSRLTFGNLRISLYPAPPDSKSDNDRSLLTVVETHNKAIALTGDASQEIERFWIQQSAPKCQIIKAGHHGSNLSLSTDWLNYHQPETVVFSCGRNNPFGHPAPEAVERAVGSNILRTDWDGNITFWWTGTNFEKSTTEKSSPLMKLFNR
ncbi:MAG: MBL fold metallo-hydrolase [Fimbriimonadaceae bacterium]|nr:MAG: MBL fold metallo-hydrolase [Fimbriimonadaceae bacterium]